MKKIFRAFIVLILICVAICPFLKKYMDKHYCEEILNVKLPRSSEILKQSDSDGGFLGDGIYSASIKIDKKEIHNFVNDLKRNNWCETPVDTDMYSLLCNNIHMYDNNINIYDNNINMYNNNINVYDQIPHNISNGIYYFKDRYAEMYPNEKSINITERFAQNFIFSTLDLDTGILYILKYDS